ncbi:MAG: DUF2780 domain-containing protein [Methylomonas sp.]|nr:DUF2780 domain-containing protein [Methylomonas sp.]
MKYVMSSTLAGAVILAAGCAPAQQQTSQNWAWSGQQAPAVQQVAAASSEMDLVNVLVNQLGVNSQQAMGGVGSIFSLAQQRMNPGDFTQLSGSVPGMNQYLSAVPRPSSSRVLLGSAADSMGDQAGGLGNLAALSGSFQSLGMNTSMIGRFVPVVLQYVQGQSGPAMMSLLQGALY